MCKFIAGNISWEPLNSILRLCSSWLTFSQVHLPLHLESDVIAIARMLKIAINHNCCNANHNCRKKNTIVATPATNVENLINHNCRDSNHKCPKFFWPFYYQCELWYFTQVFHDLCLIFFTTCIFFPQKWLKVHNNTRRWSRK